MSNCCYRFVIVLVGSGFYPFVIDCVGRLRSCPKSGMIEAILKSHYAQIISTLHLLSYTDIGRHFGDI